MATGSAMDRLARSVAHNGQASWVPRAPQQTMVQGFVTAVDQFSGTVGFQFNDPSGLVLPGVRFLQSYSSANPPAVGHVVWAQHFGTDIVVLGQHVVPPNLVIP